MTHRLQQVVLHVLVSNFLAPKSPVLQEWVTRQQRQPQWWPAPPRAPTASRPQVSAPLRQPSVQTRPLSRQCRPHLLRQPCWRQLSWRALSSQRSFLPRPSSQFLHPRQTHQLFSLRLSWPEPSLPPSSSRAFLLRVERRDADLHDRRDDECGPRVLPPSCSTPSSQVHPWTQQDPEPLCW